MAKKIAYSKQAYKVLNRMPVPESKRIKEKIEQYAADPLSMANHVKKLSGEAFYRLRIGDWRVIFDENEIVIEIIKIGPRGDVYKGPEL